MKNDALIHKRKERLSHLYDEDKLPFHSVPDDQICCDECGKTTCWVEAHDGLSIPAHWKKFELVEIEDDTGDGVQRLCRDCFCAKYYINGCDLHVGNPHTATPSSQNKYDGGCFYGCEW